MIDHTEVLEPCTRSRSSYGISMKLHVRDGHRKLQAATADEDEPDEAGKEPHAEVITQGTSSDVKCKGKYRIMVKGPARHGCGCCGGT